MEKSKVSDPQSIGEQIGAALRSIHPLSTAKLVARDAQTSQRTAENWLDGTSTPSLIHFARLIGKHPQLFMLLQPIVAWAEMAVAVVEMEASERQRADASARVQRAAARMRRIA